MMGSGAVFRVKLGVRNFAPPEKQLHLSFMREEEEEDKNEMVWKN